MVATVGGLDVTFEDRPARDLATARFNLREICKELLLLERHLVDPEKDCVDCIRKHALSLEAYLDEARRMSPSAYELTVLNDLAPIVARIQDAIRAGAAYADIAPDVRKLRKSLLAKVF